jgi:hypothetical protein
MAPVDNINIPEDLITYLDGMLFDMDKCRLEVCLIPSRRDPDGKIRAASGQNSLWYQTLCAAYPRPGCTKAKIRTIIKRQYIIKVLERMISRKRSRSKYAEYLLDVARDRREFYDSLEKQDEDVLWNNQF